jgi:hypothetical protein
MVLAHHTWVEWRRPGLVARNYTWDSVMGDPPPKEPGTILSWAFTQHMRKVNLKANERREKF